MNADETFRTIRQLCDDATQPGAARHGVIDAYAIRDILDQYTPEVPPGRCGARSPEMVGPDARWSHSCELLAGHRGMHQTRSYPSDTLSPGCPISWSGPTA